jgi:hypothetical protein
VNEVAQLIRTSGNNITQMIKRGHIPFDLVRVGARIFFPTLPLAAWMCGEIDGNESDSSACAVPLPKKTSARVRSKNDFKDRLMALKKNVDGRAQKLREADDQNGFKKAKNDHAKASADLFQILDKMTLTDLEVKELGGMATRPKKKPLIIL